MCETFLCGGLGVFGGEDLKVGAAVVDMGVMQVCRLHKDQEDSEHPGGRYPVVPRVSLKAPAKRLGVVLEEHGPSDK